MTDEQQRADTSTQDPAKKVRRSMATRNGSAKWAGDLKTGSGELTVGEAAWTSAYSARSRFAGVLPGFEHGEGTNPEELLTAAHAACFSMALSLALSDAGHPPSSINTTAHSTCASLTVRRRSSRSISTLRQMCLDWTRKSFQDHAQQAKTSCIISRALGGVGHINLSATLAS